VRVSRVVYPSYLGNFGAHVIKIEREGKGADLRSWREEGHSIYLEDLWPQQGG
jgi:crotonobetainyl-CoA:carnitine CoA-transferase CaiB-like acyl-CoA transferase